MWSLDPCARTRFIDDLPAGLWVGATCANDDIDDRDGLVTVGGIVTWALTLVVEDVVGDVVRVAPLTVETELGVNLGGFEREDANEVFSVGVAGVGILPLGRVGLGG